MDKHRRRFFWACKKKKRNYYMVKWTKVCRSKGKGGLGVKDLRKQNISLMCKWWYKLEKQGDLWQRIMRKKYMRGKHIRFVKMKSSDSPCWRNLLKVKDT
jgi:hypothetical protein